MTESPIRPWTLLTGCISGACAMLVAVAAASAQTPFAEPYDLADGSVAGVTSLVAGDINGNGRADVVVLEGGKHGRRPTFAWFEAPQQAQGDWQRHDITHQADLRAFLGSARLADINGDGDLDLIVSSDKHSGGDGKADVFVLVNPGPDQPPDSMWETHRANAESLSLHHINDMEVADMDGDGKPDIVVRSLTPNQIHLFFQDSPEAWEHRAIDTDIPRSEGLAVGDLNADGFTDVTFTGYWFKAPQNPRTGDYTRLAIDEEFAAINQNTKEAVGDLNGDGALDVVIGPAERFRSGGDHHLAWYENVDQGQRWIKHIIAPSTNNNHTVRLGDMDGDGHLDVVTGIPWGRKTIRVYVNDGEGEFGEAQVVVAGKGLYTGMLADVDADGDLDIVGQDAYAGTSQPWVYENLTAD